MNEDTDEDVRRLEMQRYPLRRILAFLPAILFFALMAWLFLRPGYGLLRPESERQAYAALTSIERLLNEISSPPGAVLVYERCSVCGEWQEATSLAIYATNRPWEKIESYYRNRAGSSVWTSCHSINGEVYCSNSRSEEAILFLHVAPTDGEGHDLPGWVMKRAHQVGTIVYGQALSMRSPARPVIGPNPMPRPCPDPSSWERSGLGWRPVTKRPRPTTATAPTIPPYPFPQPPPQSDPYSIPFYP